MEITKQFRLENKTKDKDPGLVFFWCHADTMYGASVPICWAFLAMLQSEPIHPTINLTVSTESKAGQRKWRKVTWMDDDYVRIKDKSFCPTIGSLIMARRLGLDKIKCFWMRVDNT